MKLSKIKNKKKARIEIIPLIDIMFFLLATFVLVSLSMTENRGLGVKLPSSKSLDKDTQKSNKDSYTISITETGQLALNKEPISLEELKLKLKSKNISEKTSLIVMGDKNSKLQDSINILDLSRELNIQSITLRTNSPSENN